MHGIIVLSYWQKEKHLLCYLEYVAGSVSYKVSYTLALFDRTRAPTHAVSPNEHKVLIIWDYRAMNSETGNRCTHLLSQLTALTITQKKTDQN